jgi:hypothetical protein
MLVLVPTMNDEKMEHWWTNKRQGKWDAEKLAKCHCVHHKSYTDCPGIKPEAHELRHIFISTTL